MTSPSIKSGSVPLSPKAPAMLAAASAVSGTLRKKPRTAIAVSPGRASARIGGNQQTQPHRRGDQTRNKHQDRGNGDQRAVTQCASWFRQAGSQPQEPSAELPATERRQQTEPEDERRQQHQQSPAKPDRRRQRENHRELDDGVAEQQPRHHVTPTSAG